MTAIPVITIIQVTPVEGKEQELLTWFDDIASDAARFEGHQGSRLFQPVTGSGKRWLSLFTFDTFQHLDAWQHSGIRANHLAAGAELFDEQVRRQQMVGIEFWFEDKDRLKLGPPPRWKMAIVTGVVILVLLNTLIAWLSNGLTRLHLPSWVIRLCSVGLMISLMTWIVMPWMTRILRKWLVA
jgi:uncharacterized protein